MQSATILVVIFKLLCIVGATSMVGYWIHKYHMNKDLTEIEYVPMEDVEGVVYPATSICFAMPFINNDLMNITNGKSVQNPYFQYLQGADHYNRYKGVGYVEVTPNLLDYFKNLEILLKTPKANRPHEACKDLVNCPYLTLKNHYNGFENHIFEKCFSVEIKPQFARNISNYNIWFNSSITSVLNQVLRVYVVFFQPNQYLRDRGGFKLVWRNTDQVATGEIFQMTSIEILKRRSKSNNQCLNDWGKYDDLVLEHYLDTVKCRPPYMEQYVEIPECKTQEKVREAYYDGRSFAKKTPILDPCQEMPFVHYKHEYLKIDKDETNGLDGYGLTVILPTMAKIITQSQAVDAHSLVGNIGGYIGLFLGK